MIAAYRQAFNASFSEERYRTFVDSLTNQCDVPIEFRLSETPCFFPASLIDDLARAAREMIQQLLGDEKYRRAAEDVVPPEFRIPNGEHLPTFVQVDFGLVRVGDRFEGRLVELQAFPSLYGFQVTLAETARRIWKLEGASVFPAGLDHEGYVKTLGQAIAGDHDPAEVVLMEIDPAKQKTLPDFSMTEKLWGVRAIDIRAVMREGNGLFYTRDGQYTRIRRIYNRVIPDDLARTGIPIPFDYRDALDVEWTGGPDWFFRLSKFSLPWLRHPWVPKTMFLSDLAGSGSPWVWGQTPAVRCLTPTHGDPRPTAFRPGDPNWLLKPLFSYAGGGIIFGPTEADIAAIPEHQRHLYVIQERVNFTPVIDTPFGATQAEIRMMFVVNAKPGVLFDNEPTKSTPGFAFVLPLVRMGRGRMMGVDHNKGLHWVGAAAALIA